MTLRSRLLLIPVTTAVFAGSIGAVSYASSESPAATPAATCNVSKVGRKLGPTYVTSLMQVGSTCNSAVSLVKAYYRCRVSNGGKKGRCSQVSGFRCTEVRRAIKTQFSAKATCRKGSVTVVHTYTQFT